MGNLSEDVQTAANFLKGIANPHRLLILCHLSTGEKSVSQMIEATGLSQTSMSQHLSKLRDEKIVTFRRDHRTLFYCIDNKSAKKIMDILYKEFCQNEPRHKSR